MSMFKNKFTILVLGIVTVLTFGVQLAFAQDKPSVVVSPSSLTKNVGDNFDLAVKVNPAGQKVCAVEGQLVLSKLISQKIEVAKGIISQTPPSFSNGFYFLLGIPGCSTQNKTLFTIKVKANAVGQANASFRKIDIIGEGKSISSNFSGGNYKIVVPQAPAVGKKTSKPSIAKTPAVGKKVSKLSVTKTSCVCENWTSWQNEKCGENGCLETQMSQTRNRTCVPSGCDIEKQTQCVNDSTCVVSAKKPKISKSVNSSSAKSPLVAAISNVMTLGTGRSLVAVLLGLIIVLLILFYFIRRNRLRKNTKN